MIHQNLNMIWGYTWIILRFKTLFRDNDGTPAINHNMPCNPTTFQKLRLAITQAKKKRHRNFHTYNSSDRYCTCRV